MPRRDRIQQHALESHLHALLELRAEDARCPLILEERESTLVVPVAADVKILADYTVAVTIREFT